MEPWSINHLNYHYFMTEPKNTDEFLKSLTEAREKTIDVRNRGLLYPDYKRRPPKVRPRNKTKKPGLVKRFFNRLVCVVTGRQSNERVRARDQLSKQSSATSNELGSLEETTTADDSPNHQILKSGQPNPSISTVLETKPTSTLQLTKAIVHVEPGTSKNSCRENRNEKKQTQEKINPENETKKSTDIKKQGNEEILPLSRTNRKNIEINEPPRPLGLVQSRDDDTTKKLPPRPIKVTPNLLYGNRTESVNLASSSRLQKEALRGTSSNQAALQEPNLLIHRFTILDDIAVGCPVYSGASSNLDSDSYSTRSASPPSPAPFTPNEQTILREKLVFNNFVEWWGTSRRSVPVESRRRRNTSIYHCVERDNWQEASSAPNLRNDANNYHLALSDLSYSIRRNYWSTRRGTCKSESKKQPARRRHECRRMRRMERNALEEHERKIIIEFCHLLEKSKQLFNGLRELPQYGHKQWHSYFGRTFDVYTKLWKFQQQHRNILDSKYGLKRWQIGEIASKIGQLYYHFYLRTSETAYLIEAYAFYFAIRSRCYYTKASKEDRCELMVKKLRYYARFIVVCLLLKKISLVRELVKELDRQIVEYGNTYDPDDQMEWTVVVDEVRAFIQAEPVIAVIHPDNYLIVVHHRLSPASTPPVERTPQMTVSLQEALIIGSNAHQVKVSELTIDMFRMLQTLERELPGEPQAQYVYDDSPRQRYISTPSAPTSKGYNVENGPRQDNPHKYLLFKPSPNQLLVYLASGCNDLPSNAVMLLYISADGHIVPPSKNPEDGCYDVGGLFTTSKCDAARDTGKESRNMPPKKDSQLFHPGDLLPFTRRPLFLIVDSDNSFVFQNLPRHFGYPLVILMSPTELPSPFIERKNHGNLFTLFLHSPLMAFCYSCEIHTLSVAQWDRGLNLIDNFMVEASQAVTRSRVDVAYIMFMGDDFLRVLILRFIFCEITLRLHRAFRTRANLTRSSPSLPEDLFDHPALLRCVMDLASHLQVRSHFHEPNTSGPGTSRD